METIDVHAGRDTLLALAERATALDAVAELIWNAIDADATEVLIEIAEAGISAESLIVKDNGHGMTVDQARTEFSVHGESWKKNARLTKVARRPMHGRMGRGRFLAFGLADRIKWVSVSSREGEAQEIVIEGLLEELNKFSFDGPNKTDGAPGTTVTCLLRQRQRVNKLLDPEFSFQLLGKLAPTLLAREDLAVTFRGRALDPRELVGHTVNLFCDVRPEALRGHPAPTLELVEWSRNMGGDARSRELFLCDQAGTVISAWKMPSLPLAPLSWTAYLRWEGFSDPELMGPADVHVPEVQHFELLSSAHQALTLYLSHRLEVQRGRLIQEWKDQKVYPYQDAPSSPAEEIERDVFDVVAVVASDGIGTSESQKKLSLRLLKEGIQSRPDNLPKILEAVFALTEDDQEVLSELLDRTQLASIVQSARTVADRADFIHGLNGLLFADESRTRFREVDQLHPMLVREPWVFGDEWTLTLSESGLTGVVRSALAAQGTEIEFASHPVTLPDGKRGRVDMAFYRYLAESDRGRHLVVELKRPGKLTMAEYGQLANYAVAITEHPQVATAPNLWDFWLIATELDPALSRQASNGAEPGLALDAEKYRLWVVTWAQLLDRAARRIEAFRKQLDIVSSETSSRSYLERVHSELIPEVRVDAASPASS